MSQARQETGQGQEIQFEMRRQQSDLGRVSRALKLIQSTALQFMRQFPREKKAARRKMRKMTQRSQKKSLA